MSRADDPMVANPRYQALKELRQHVKANEEKIESALDNAAKRMGQEKTWIGPTGEKFADELNGRKKKLHTLTRRLLAQVDSELKTVPHEVPASEARAWTQNMARMWSMR